MNSLKKVHTLALLYKLILEYHLFTVDSFLDAISIEQSIGNIFQLKSFTDVIVNKVDPRFVELDSLELTFKDQYLGRSEMWRLKNCLVSTCVYIQKKLEFCSSNIRCQICELWSGGNKVSSGLVTETTKVFIISIFVNLVR